MPHRALLAKVWGLEYEDTTNYLRVYCRLREKIEPNPDVPWYLQTERGIGYRFVQLDSTEDGHALVAS